MDLINSNADSQEEWEWSFNLYSTDKNAGPVRLSDLPLSTVSSLQYTGSDKHINSSQNTTGQKGKHREFLRDSI